MVYAFDVMDLAAFVIIANCIVEISEGVSRVKSVIVKLAALALCFVSQFASAELSFTKDDLELVKAACLAGSSFDFKTEADGSISVKNLEGKGRLAIGKKEVTTVDLPDSDKKQEFNDIRSCISGYLVKGEHDSKVVLRLAAMERNVCIDGGIQPVSVKADLVVDGHLHFSIDADDKDDYLSLGILRTGTHAIELRGIEASCAGGYYAMRVPINLVDDFCSAEFNVRSAKTYALLVRSIDGRPTCSIE